jgi:hypothetical protein
MSLAFPSFSSLVSTHTLDTCHKLQQLVPTDEGLVPDLSRGRGRSIGGDLDVGEEGFEQTIVTLQSLHHNPVGYQHTRT